MSFDAASASATAGLASSRVELPRYSAGGGRYRYELRIPARHREMESNFNPSATASTSSARGLFQFIDQTWLGTVKEAGAALGYGQYADAISKSPSGMFSVSDPAARKAILDSARRSDRERRNGRGVDALQQFQADRQDRPPAD